MQVIGDFIGLGANERLANAVDRTVKRIDGNTAKLLGKALPKARIVMLPKPTAPTDKVFP